MPETLQVTATDAHGEQHMFDATVRIDTPAENGYYRHGGILRYMLRELAGA